MIFRTSAGPFARPLLALSPGGALVAGASGKGFAGPVVWCCTPEGEERVVYSDGRTGALRPTAVAFDGEVARAVLVSGDSSAIVERLLDGSSARESIDRLQSTFALGSRRIAENNAGFVLTSNASAREGELVRPTPQFTGSAPAGTVRRLVVDGDRVVGVVQRPRRWEIYRYSGDGQTRRLMWRGSRRPTQIAVGRGSIAASTGRTIWLGRGNRRLTPQRQAGGRVRALAVDGTRVAWLEQRGKVQRVRLGRVR